MSVRLHEAIHDQLEHLDAQMAVVRGRLDALPEGGFDPDLAKAGAALSRAVKDISAELRQLEKHDRRMTLTPEQRFAELLKYVRSLSPPQISVLRETLIEMQRGRAA